MLEEFEVLQAGEGALLGWHDPDENRAWVRDNKTRTLVDKRMTVYDAVATFVHDGDYLAIGGFGHVRVSMALLYEIVRQRRKSLIIAGKPSVHDIDVLIGAGCVSQVECAYAFGHELRGLSPAGRRAVESGRVKVAAEESNAASQWRFLAGMMGVPFMPMRAMIGTDTFRCSPGKVVRDPWSGKPVVLVPAAYPDVAIFHVHRCDRYGNCQIDGMISEDIEIARAARRVIVSAEEIVSDEEIRREPRLTVIPFYVVDAVCEVRYGAHPTQMAYEYYFDEIHIRRWLESGKTEAGTQAYLKQFVYDVPDFAAYLAEVGGQPRMAHLERLEGLLAPLVEPED